MLLTQLFFHLGIAKYAIIEKPNFENQVNHIILKGNNSKKFPFEDQVQMSFKRICGINVLGLSRYFWGWIKSFLDDHAMRA